jgi:hypothetical protein
MDNRQLYFTSDYVVNPSDMANLLFYFKYGPFIQLKSLENSHGNESYSKCKRLSEVRQLPDATKPFFFHLFIEPCKIIALHLIYMQQGCLVKRISLSESQVHEGYY